MFAVSVCVRNGWRAHGCAMRPSGVVRWGAMAVALGGALFVASHAGAAEPQLSWKNWHIYGSDTVRADGYNSYGDNTSSPYPYTGMQTYDELNLGLDRAITPYDRITGQVNGLLYNDSPYRSAFRGAVPEQLNIRQENGDFVLPYRAEAGDFFAFQSMLTVQRSLKGIQVELQPDLGGDIRNSLLLFSGGASPSWRSFQLKDDWSNGASWLVDSPTYGRVGINLVLNHRKADQASGLQSARQYVYSLAYEKQGVWSPRWPWLAQRLTVEGEAGRFIGDTSGAITGQHHQGDGYYLQMSGSPVALGALSYRLRYEAYGQYYQPAGAVIQPDRRSKEGHLAWRFSNGLTARTRIQDYLTAWKTINPIDTVVYGANLSGPLPGVTDLSVGVDAFEQNTKSRDLTTNTVTKSVNASLNKRISSNVSARAGFFYANARDRTNPTTGVSITRQFSAGMDFQVRKFGFTGTVSPGLIARRSDTQGGMTNWDFNPTLYINANRGPHSFSISYSALDQSRPQNNLGLLTHTAALNYSYQKGDYTMGLEGDWYLRKPDMAVTERTRSWRVGVFLTRNFDKPASVRQISGQGAVQPAAPTASSFTQRFALDLTHLRPGMREADARKVAAAAGFGKPARQAGFLVWFARVMRDVDQRQRLAVEVSNSMVTRAALIIDFDDVGNSADVRRTFEHVRQQLLQQYGQPDTFFNQGNFGTTLATDLAANRFIRVMQWNRSDGVLRFGIPRRLDGKVRMEVQFARAFPPFNRTLWSIEPLQ